ncbi:MAG: hypothetical protein JXB14_04935 [Candidatus Altiarchaeota archaeon]|nr:hypothetical protein [Candidatus Altiarchaeota archaeon]
MLGAKSWGFVAVLIIALANPAASQTPPTTVIVNSADGMDVYSSLVYSNLLGAPCDFIMSAKHAPLVGAKLTGAGAALLIESKTAAYYYGFKSILLNKGYTVDEIISENGLSLNLELAKRTDTHNFVVIDTSYGYNAVSVAPYALNTRSYVLLVNSINIDDVYDFLKARGVDKLLVYGYVEDVVGERLSEFNPETIYNQDKYVDNIDLVKKIRGLSSVKSKQVVLTDGTFLEKGFMSGSDPILLIGQRIPDPVLEYLTGNDIRIGLVVGDLVAPAQQLKRTLTEERNTPFSVIVKFGQSIPTIQGSQISYLDTFPLPAYPLDMDVVDAKYNKATRKLEVTYKNKVDASAWFTSNIEILLNGQRVQTLGDAEPLVIGKSQLLGRSYDLDLSNVDVTANITARVTILFGEYPKSLDRALTKEFLVAFIERVDKSSLAVVSLMYDENLKQIILNIKNTGETAVYFRPSFTLLIGGSSQIFELDTVQYLDVGQSKGVHFGGVDLTDEDLRRNQFVDVHIDYGDREAFLVNALDVRAELGTAKPIQPAAGPIVIPPIVYQILIAIVGVMIMVFLLKMRKPVKIITIIYNTATSEFAITVKNKSRNVLYVKPLIKYIEVAKGESRILGEGMEGRLIEAKELRKFVFNIELTEPDIEANRKVKASVLFGKSLGHYPDSLTKGLTLHIEKEKKELTEKLVEDASKEELVKLCEERKLPAEGSAKELRERLLDFLKKEKKELTEELIEDSSKEELVKLCGERKLPVEGEASELRERLREWLKSQAEELTEELIENASKEELVKLCGGRKLPTEGGAKELRARLKDYLQQKLKLTEEMVHDASKEELVKLCGERKLPAEGNAKELRQRLLEFLSEGEKELTEELITDASSEELVKLCADNDLPTTGSEEELREQLKVLLANKELEEIKEKLKKAIESEKKSKKQGKGEKPEKREETEEKEEGKKGQKKGLGLFGRKKSTKPGKSELTEDIIEDASKDELIKLCEERGLPTEGNAVVLRELLIEHLEKKHRT